MNPLPNEKVALVTGAASGIGRACAVALAAEGASIIGIDLPQAESELQSTRALIEASGGEMFVANADVRDQAEVEAAISGGSDALGRVGIVVASAGIVRAGFGWELTESEWQDVLDVNLTGSWHTLKAVVPSMISAHNGGSIVLISSTAGLKGAPSVAGYSASKHGVVGLMRTFSLELGQYNIRVNSVHPTSVRTKLSGPARGREILTEHHHLAASFGNALPVGLLDPIDVANAVLWLSSNRSRYVTGVALPVDAGALVR